MENTTSVTNVSMKCLACEKSTNYIIDGLCLDCAYKKMQIDMNKRTIVGGGTVGGVGWVCPKCGSVYGPNQTVCWKCMNKDITCSGTVIGDAGRYYPTEKINPTTTIMGSNPCENCNNNPVNNPNASGICDCAAPYIQGSDKIKY